MKSTSLRTLLLLAVLILGLPGSALAHKVTIFAYVDGSNIVADCFYSGGDKVRSGEVAVSDATTGEELARGQTDDKGAFVTPLPVKAVTAKHPIKLTLIAGEGHRNDTLVKPAEYAAAAKGLTAPAAKSEGKPETNPTTKPETKPDAKQTATPQAVVPARTSDSASTQLQSPPAGQVIDEAALSRIVEEAVERKLAPVKQMLAASAEKGPSVTEIIGGIGYIFGLFGVAAYVASRKKGR